MGTICTPAYANIFMASLESKFIAAHKRWQILLSASLSLWTESYKAVEPSLISS